jgi:hypothetical protein
MRVPKTRSSSIFLAHFCFKIEVRNAAPRWGAIELPGRSDNRNG